MLEALSGNFCSYSSATPSTRRRRPQGLGRLPVPSLPWTTWPRFAAPY